MLKINQPKAHVIRSTGGYYGFSLMILLGVLTAFYLLRNYSNSVFNLFSSNHTVLIGCTAVLVLIALSGFNLFGSALICCLDYLFGILISAGAFAKLFKIASFSGIWFFGALFVFAQILCALLVSSISAGMSKELLAKLKPDSRFKAKIIKNAFCCIAAIVFMTSVFAVVFKLRPDLYI